MGKTLYATVWMLGWGGLSLASSGDLPNLLVSLGISESFLRTIPFIAWSVPPANLLLPLAIWTAVVLLLFILIGDRSGHHRSFIRPYRGIWIALIIISLFTIVANLFAYGRLEQQVAGLTATTRLTTDTVGRLHNTAQYLTTGIQGFLSYLGSPDAQADLSEAARDLSNAQAELQTATANPEQVPGGLEGAQARLKQAQDSYQRVEDQRQRAIEFARTYLTNTQSLTDSAIINAQAARVQIAVASTSANQNDKLRLQLAQTSRVLEHAGQSYDAIPQFIASVERQFVTAQRDGKPVREIQSSVAGLYSAVDRASATTRIARESLASADTEVTAKFIWIGAFYSTFVIFPWVLFLLFIYRRTQDRAGQIAEDLRRLDPTEGLLIRALGAPVEAANQAPGSATNGKPDGQVRAGDRASTTDQIHRHTLHDTQRALIVQRQLATRAFSNFEYVLILTVLTVLTAISWFFIFYPRTGAGLATMIADESGVLEISRYLVRNLTPITMGFVGAYFYVLQMLVRRYLAGDLYPSAFLQAAVRIMTVFTLSLLLGVAYAAGLTDPTVGANQTSPGWGEAIGVWASGMTVPLAFFIGIFPDAFVQLAAGWVNRRVKSRFQEGIESAPVTKLDGLSIWNQARLLEEHVENVEAMATAHIDQLVLRTHFPTGQLVDWVDQAILYTHAGSQGEWFAPLRGTGIRTATDLLNATGLNLLSPGHLRYRDFWPAPQALARVVTAVNAAATERAVPSDDPRAAVRNAAVAAHVAAVKLVDGSETVASLSAQIGDDPTTYDRAIGTRNLAKDACKVGNDLIGELETLVQRSTALRERYQDARIGPVADLVDPIEHLTETERVVQRLVRRIDQLASPMTLQPASLRDLPTLKDDLDHLAESILAIEFDVRILDRLARMARNLAPIRETAELCVQQIEVVRAAADTTRRAVGAARASATRLDAGRPETLDAREELKSGAQQLLDLTKDLAGRCQTLKQKAEEAGTGTSQLDASFERAVEAAKRAVLAAEAAHALGLRDRPAPDADSIADRAAFDELARASRQARGVVEQAQSAAQAAFDLRLLTTEVLYVMCDTIWPEINMQYVLNYYSEIGESLVGRDRVGAKSEPGAYIVAASRIAVSSEPSTRA